MEALFLNLKNRAVIFLKNADKVRLRQRTNHFVSEGQRLNEYRSEVCLHIYVWLKVNISLQRERQNIEKVINNFSTSFIIKGDAPFCTKKVLSNL